MSIIDLSTVLPAVKQGLGNIDFAILGEFLDKQQVSKGDVVARGGEDMDFAFVTVQGSFSTNLVSSNAEQYELKHARPGRWIGQMYFLEAGENPLTITALEDGAIARLSKESFDRMVQMYPATADKLLHTISVELSNSMRKAGKLLFKRFAWDQVDGTEGEEAAKQWFTKVYCEMNVLFA